MRRAPFLFVATVDTEGDDIWSRPDVISTENARHLPRFQALCERFGIRPVYLVAHEMAVCPRFRRFGRALVRRGAAEIGAHPHPWSSPPLADLTGDDRRHLPYLTDYDAATIAAKLARLTGTIADAFGGPPVSHRAGRWGFDGRVAAALPPLGYRIDCSVTPHIDWRGVPGAPGGAGGPDYRGFPERPYFLDGENIARPGTGPLLEVPVTVRTFGGPLAALLRRPFARGSLPRRVVNRIAPEEAWLRPDGLAPDRLARLLLACRAAGMPHAQFMIHSSELMPGGHPALPDAAAIDRIYAQMERLFRAAARVARPVTLRELHELALSGSVALEPARPVR